MYECEPSASRKVMKRELRTYFLGVELSSPLVLPAGVLDISFSSLSMVSNFGAGLLTTKSLTAEPRKGHEGPVVSEVEGGMLNAMGLCNPGIAAGLEEIERFRTVSDKPVILSVFATDAAGFTGLAAEANRSTADFLET